MTRRDLIRDRAQVRREMYKRTVTCSFCGGLGHNRATCKDAQVRAEPLEPALDPLAPAVLEDLVPEEELDFG